MSRVSGAGTVLGVLVAWAALPAIASAAPPRPIPLTGGWEIRDELAAPAPPQPVPRLAARAEASRARLAGAPLRTWLPLTRRISQRWVGLQERDGSFPDPLLAPGLRSRYGEAMLGYALIQSGLRDHRQPDLDAGLRAITWATRRSDSALRGDAPFENLAVAGAYTLMRRSAPGYRPFRRVRKRWEWFMRSRVRVYIHRAGAPLAPDATRGYWNKWLVESIAMLEFLRSGLSSKRPGTALAEQPDTYRRIVAVVNGIIPDMAAQRTVANGRGDFGFVLSDPPADPLAYHAFSLGLLARAIRLLGPAAGTRARQALVRMVDASWSLTAPDGDLAYVGRSQEQAWALSFTAYGAEVAAGLTRERRRADRARGLAERAVARLRALYPLVPSGLAITPGVGRDMLGGRAGLDSYAHMVDYNGLTLLGLDWAIAESRGRRTSTAPLGSDSLGALLVGTGTAAMAAVRTPSTWFVVKRSRSDPQLRYDFGLVALKRQTEQGWRDVLPLRPVGTGPDTAGPILVVGGVRAEPFGDTLATTPGGTVTIDGGFTDAAGTVVRRVRFTFVPVEDGVRLSFAAKAGDTYELSSFHRAPPSTSASGGSWLTGTSDEGVRTEAPLGLLGSPKIDLVPGYASATDFGLTRARATFSLASNGDVVVTYGPTGA